MAAVALDMDGGRGHIPAGLESPGPDRARRKDLPRHFAWYGLRLAVSYETREGATIRGPDEGSVWSPRSLWSRPAFVVNPEIYA